MPKKILILGTDPKTIINFRKELIVSILKKNIGITIVSSDADADAISRLTNIGANYQSIVLKRNGLNFFYDLLTLLSLVFLFKKKKPDFILAYGIKLVIWGGIASIITRKPFFALITGLGFAFQGRSLKRRMLTNLVSFLYKIALTNSKAVIFQNKDNLNVFVDNRIICSSKAFIVPGSGVNTSVFNTSPTPTQGFNFLCISRLLGEKGLREYAAAAKIVKYTYPSINFMLVGDVDTSPDAIPLCEVNSWIDYIEYNGYSEDIRPYIRNSHVFVLPSYHEGIPKSVLEAMSMGRPIITTNAVGCKETVREGYNGFKVSIGSVPELVDRMLWFIHNKDKVNVMGINSRSIVESKFDVKNVNIEMLKILTK